MSRKSISPDVSPAAAASPAPALGTGEAGKFGFDRSKGKTPNLGPLTVALKPPGSATGEKKKQNQKTWVRLHS